MASAAPISAEPTQGRPSFAKVAAPTYKPHATKESAPGVKSPVAVPQVLIQQNSQKRSTPANGSAPKPPSENSNGNAKDKAGNTAARTGQWANATREQVVLQPESKGDETEKPRPSIALVKFSAAEDSTTQLSSSDGSAKPASIDGKSVASGTTFALDEKESIRPDDSASLRAVEEEDVTSPPESNAAGSRVGSDSEARAFRAQLHEIAVMGPQPQRGIVPGRFPNPSTNGPPTLYDPNQPANGMGRPMSQPLGNGIPAGPSAQNMPAIPDEKLIEALQSPRDRLFVVKIEQDFIDFIKDSGENEYCLPNCNTFYRMLAHRLADYYLLGHVVDSTMTGVRITRTPYCRIPPPLSQMVDASKSADTPPVDLPARKIMRRGDEKSGTNTTANSENQSKATSEVGGSDGGNDAGGKPKDKSALTREEREARYREARQRIFGNVGSEENESPEANTSTEEKVTSRSSSASGKRKNNKKQRNFDDDDGFEARSRYNAYYPGQFGVPGYTGDGTVYYNGYAGPTPNPQYAPMHPNASPPQAYANGFPPVVPQDVQSQYGWPNQQQYPSPNGPMMYQGYGQVQNGYDLSADFQRGMQSFQTPNLPNQMTPKMANASMAGYQDPYAQPPPMNPGWSQMNQQQPAYPVPQGPYPANGTRPMTAPMPGPPPSYPYGQFPPQTFNGKPGRHQHPIPGSYQRPTFNPQSQAFVPGHNMPFSMPPNAVGPPGMNYGNFQQMPHQMARTSPPSVNTQTFGSPGHMTNNPSSTSNSSPSAQPGPSSQNLSVPAQSSIAKYGTPSNLPARPPPTQQTAPKFNLAGHNMHRVPSNPIPPFNGPPVVSVRGGGGGANGNNN
ncbi:hypothetical protein P280DRAFT_474011 [Massarina eburnea CBS 473.64]|uniref:SUZ domain-containing protein n=1 Tax=Massarina eburnea CBS 473.64 TaxID=1395130 RepID=A0A6A6RIW8_9PLEO|nr:hypothetical protein P280DRAFT_474011 [Massarina eburnea CBS 473.64]